MRKLYLTGLLTLTLFPAAYSQSPVYKITQSYYRSDPFETEFSSFLKHLLNDPTLTDKIIEKKTDTSLFYFQGTYTHHNPFFFKPQKVEVVLTETPVQLDSLKADTVYSYKLLAYSNSSKQGAGEVKKEFEKIFRKYKGNFRKNSYTENPPGSKIPGASYNFFDPFCAVAPFAVTWLGPDENKTLCLILTIRMSAKNNRAILPVPFYTF